jgi:hypothetical protein
LFDTEFENFLLCERILINVTTCHLSKRNVKVILKVLSDLEPLRGSSNKKTLYSTRSCVNLGFLARVGHKAHDPTNSSNKLLLSIAVFLFTCIVFVVFSDFDLS